MDDVRDVLAALNNNLARLVMTQTAIADELNMIRRGMEGDAGSNNCPVSELYDSLGIVDSEEPQFV